MKVYRIHLSSWTASFRYPNLISGFQPTLTAPPLSTINGLISAAKGNYFCVSDEKVGFFFNYKAKTVDLETVYPIDKKGKNSLVVKGKKHVSTVINREFLSDVELFLYTDSEEIAGYFRNPQYQLLLGRSGDLAQVNGIVELEVKEKSELDKVKGTIIPFRKHRIAAPLQALPTSFSNEIPRKNLGTQPYFIVDCKSSVAVNAQGFSDMIGNDEIDIYWQEL